MPTHSSLTGSDLHEPKGAAAANAGDIYIADGVGSGSWKPITPHGSWAYDAVGTGTTFTTPTSYTLINVVGVTTHLKDFTNNALGRLTYTGAPSKHITLTFSCTLKHSVGAGQDILFRVYKNGVATSNIYAMSADSVNYHNMNMVHDEVAVTNDYFEVFVEASGGNVVVHQARMTAVGLED